MKTKLKTSVIYASLLMYLASFDFRLLALFLCITFVLANLSSNFVTPGNMAAASSLLVVARSLRTAFLMVLP